MLNKYIHAKKINENKYINTKVINGHLTNQVS